MFSKVKGADIEQLLEEKPLRFYDEREELEDLLFDEEAEYYLSDDNAIMVNPGETREIWSMPLADDFDLKAFEDWLARQGSEFSVIMNVTGMNPGSFRYQEYYEVSEPIKSYYRKGEGELQDSFDPSAFGAEIPGTIRLLNANDEKTARNFFQTETRGIMDLGQVFSFIVKDELGKILGYFDEEGKLIGYITSMYGAYDVLVVDDLYVLSSRRKQGVASSLAKVLLAVANSESMDVYWPVAETELAQKTAESAGYEEVAQRISIRNL